jgi:hypothetical protein
VAHPIVLLLFSGTINEEYEKSKDGQRITLTNTYQTQSTQLNQQIKAQQDLLKNNNNFEPPICTHGNQAVITASDELAQLETKKAQAKENIKLFRQNAEKERMGASGEGLTGHKGCAQGSECRAWIRKANEQQDQVAILERDIQKIKAVITEQITEQQRVLANQCAEERQNWAKQMRSQNELAQKKLDSLITQSQELDKRYWLENDNLTALKPDILKQTKLLHSIMGLNNVNEIANLILFLAFMLLFLLIDMLAVLLKLSSTGLYENAVDAEEYQHHLLAFLNQRQVLIEHSVSLFSTEQKLIETVVLPNLKNQLTNNLNNIIHSFDEVESNRRKHFFASLLKTKQKKL